MTKQEILQDQVKKLIEDQNLVEQIIKKAGQAYNSGALDTDQIKEGDFEIPKLVLIAAMISVTESFMPICQHCKTEIKNLQHFI